MHQFPVVFHGHDSCGHSVLSAPAVTAVGEVRFGAALRGHRTTAVDEYGPPEADALPGHPAAEIERVRRG